MRRYRPFSLGVTVLARTRSYEMDMVNGPLLGKICRFAFPLALSSMLQLLFNAADIIVVGNWGSDTSLAAVSSTGSMVNLIVNLFIGLSIGTNVLVARYYGSGDREMLERVVHTSIATSLAAGAILAVIGWFFARPMLELMSSPENVIDQSALYVQIFFLGMPGNMLYNFGAAVLRSVGDTRRPLYFLMIAGVLNVLLNLLFVIVFKMDVAGVAVATIISQYVSAALVLICLVKSDGPYRVYLRRLRIHLDMLWGLARIGIPAGIQGIIFSLSNVIIQSSINSFGSVVMTGSGAAANLEGFVYVAMNSFYQAALSFTGQNMGAEKYERIDRVLLLCEMMVTIVGIVLGVGVYLLGHPLLSIYTNDEVAIQYGIDRLLLLSAPYFLCGMMDVLCGVMRGTGYSFIPMVVSILGVCGSRILWIYTIFAMHHTLFTLFISYPISWAATALIHLLSYFLLKKYKLNPMKKKRDERLAAEAAPAAAAV